MLWVYLLVAIGAGLIVGALGLYALVRWVERREPYGSFIHLKTRQKLAFFRRLLTDRRVPWYVKVIPVLVVLYFANPIDLIPEFIPVLGYVDDVAIVVGALALVIRLTPRSVVSDLLRQVGNQVESGGSKRP